MVYDLEVPDFSKAPIALSGMSITSPAASDTLTRRIRDPLADVLPAPPTASRDFTRSDTLDLYVEVYENVRNAEFLATQMQSAGYFQLDDDQALVLTIDPGDAGYFVVPVTNDWTITNNYWDQQTSLNISQTLKNSDGTYTIVVSPQDPAVWNWVSTGGLNQGTISIRWA